MVFISGTPNIFVRSAKFLNFSLAQLSSLSVFVLGDYNDGTFECHLSRVNPRFRNNSMHFCLMTSTSSIVLLPETRSSTYMSSEIASIRVGIR